MLRRANAYRGLFREQVVSKSGICLTWLRGHGDGAFVTANN